MEKEEEMLLMGPSNLKEELITWHNAYVEIDKTTTTENILKKIDIEAEGTGFKYISFLSDNWIHEKGHVEIWPLPPLPPPPDDC
jgi:hypothetical protein